jgi:hypothetical protein
MGLQQKSFERVKVYGAGHNWIVLFTRACPFQKAGACIEYTTESPHFFNEI